MSNYNPMACYAFLYMPLRFMPSLANSASLLQILDLDFVLHLSASPAQDVAPTKFDSHFLLSQRKLLSLVQNDQVLHAPVHGSYPVQSVHRAKKLSQAYVQQSYYLKSATCFHSNHVLHTDKQNWHR